MKNLKDLLKNYKGKKILMVFPHPDDEAYVSGGLLQIAQKYSIKTKLICMTKGGRGLMPKNLEKAELIKKVREEELEKASKILGIDEKVVWDYPDSGLIQTQTHWYSLLKREIIKSDASIVVTFDYTGITGHPDHLILSSEVFNILSKLKTKPKLLFRVPDKQEQIYFRENKALIFFRKPTHILRCSFRQSINKIRAIFAHKSQIKNFIFRLHLIDWYVIDQKELYYLVDYKKQNRLKLSN